MAEDGRHGGIAAYAAYAMLRLLGWLLGMLPYGTAQRVGGALGRVTAFFDPGHVKRAAGNIRASLGVEEDEARRIALKVYRHIGKVAAEFFQLARMKNEEEFRVRAVLDSSGELRTYFDAGKGVVVPTGHMGNWEYCGQMTAVEGMPPGSIIKRFRNPYIDAYVERVRKKWGLAPIEKSKKGVVEAVRRVRSGAVMAIMSDQHADEGIEGTFFGRECRTVDTAARIALKAGAPMVPVTSYRREDGKHVLVVWPEIDRPEGVEDEGEAARLMTQRMNEVFEEAIREHPEQWLWAQRRWRQVPMNEKDGRVR
ncbi:MAG: lysophospholipid acyltransferase family protein [Planctomycetes bacterium]|nr:lysophospholipid acyltransferase family protein [Planctomycetota bacterium]